MVNNAVRAIGTIQSALNRLRGPTVRVTVTDNGTVNSVQRRINSIRGRTVFIDVRQRLVGSRFVQHGFHGIVTQPTMFIAGEKRPERVDVGSTTSIVQPHRGGPMGGTVMRHAPVSQTSPSGGPSVAYITTVFKMDGREWKRHTDKVFLQGVESHY
jgi:hypothetical protein